MNEIQWGCPHCKRINFQGTDENFASGQIIQCEHCKLHVIIESIKYILFVRILPFED